MDSANAPIIRNMKEMKNKITAEFGIVKEVYNPKIDNIIEGTKKNTNKVR